MALFKTREPRRFQGVHIYTSERQDKLNRLVAEAKREEQIQRGETPEYTPDIESYRGKFAQNLKKAVSLDSSLKAKAQKDLEFAKFQDAVKAL